jgi:hypothetical protein
MWVLKNVRDIGSPPELPISRIKPGDILYQVDRDGVPARLDVPGTRAPLHVERVYDNYVVLARPTLLEIVDQEVWFDEHRNVAVIRLSPVCALGRRAKTSCRLTPRNTLTKDDGSVEDTVVLCPGTSGSRVFAQCPGASVEFRRPLGPTDFETILEMQRRKGYRQGYADAQNAQNAQNDTRTASSSQSSTDDADGIHDSMDSMKRLMPSAERCPLYL